LANKVIVELTRRTKSGEPIGTQTGIPYIDEDLGGLPRQTLSYLVGDSGVGKSCLATYMLLTGAKWLHKRKRGPASAYVTDNEDREVHRKHVAQKENKLPIVVFWSLEMSESMVVTRVLAQMTKIETNITISYEELLRGKLSGDQRETAIALKRGIDVIQEIGPHIAMIFRDRTIDQFMGTLRELALRYDICLVIVDYFRKIQDITMDGGVHRQEAVSSALMDMAREFDCHVMSIFDLNREGEKASRPRLYHMKWGTAARYDADYIFFMWWDRKDKRDRDEGKRIRDVRVHLELAKARSASTGKTEVWFVPECGWFDTKLRGGT